MKFATLPNGQPDGRLHIVSRDLTRATPARAAQTLQAALENWTALEPRLAAEYAALQQGGGEPFDPSTALAPLPRAWQWLDGSAFDSHGKLMDKVFGMQKEPYPKPLMYQGVSDTFYAPVAEIPFVSTADGIDFEGEFGVITDAVPMNASRAEAARHIRLIVQINDWSLRKLAPVEMKTGFGWVQAKPPCGMAPVAVTPDELGPHWRDCRVDLPLNVKWNGKPFGAASGYPMSFGFDELVAHAAYSRRLVAGTVDRLRHGLQRNLSRGRIELHRRAARHRDRRSRRGEDRLHELRRHCQHGGSPARRNARCSGSCCETVVKA